MTDFTDLLVDPSILELPPLDTQPSIERVALPSQRVPTDECGESLQPVSDRLTVLRAYPPETWPEAPAYLYVRSGVNRRLVSALEALPREFSLVVLDAWRPLRLQLALLRHYRSRIPDLEPHFVSDPDAQAWTPPHTTGGAIDITLGWRGVPLRLGTDFDAFTADAAVDALEGSRAGEPDRSLRRLLVAVLRQSGFCPYPHEWWHFSHGDEIWAFNVGAGAARYAAVDVATEPPG